MNHLLRNLGITIAALILAAPLRAAERATDVEAQKQAADWLRGLGEKGIVIEYKTQDVAQGFKGRLISGSDTTMFVLEHEAWYVTLGFGGPVKAETTVEELRQRFRYVALDRMPTPGLEVKGWLIRPTTPTSSFKDGVTLQSYEKGVLKLQIKTSCFALFGSVKRDPNEPILADAPAPQGTYFQIRQPIPLEISFRVPLQLVP